MEILKAKRLKKGATIGVFTPSWPAHAHFREKFELGLRHLEALGYKIKLGSLTKTFSHQGYKTASGRERAREFMELIQDNEVDALMSTIGGNISNGLIEFLDFEEIRRQRKPIIGYSDVTSLLLAIHARAGLAVFYGPAVVPSFGESPAPIDETVTSFTEVVVGTSLPRTLQTPATWSNHFRDAATDAWKTVPREFKTNEGWQAMSPGLAKGKSVVANLNTLSACLGTPYVPDFQGKILFIEQMLFNYEREERQIVQLKLAGVFKQIAGLVISKPEVVENCRSTLSCRALYEEILGPQPYPVVWNFDCGHTHPMVTMPMGVEFALEAHEGGQVKIVQMESAVE